MLTKTSVIYDTNQPPQDEPSQPSLIADAKVPVPKEVLDAIEALLDEFLSADLEPRLQYYREEEDDQQQADKLEASAAIYGEWCAFENATPTQPAAEAVTGSFLVRNWLSARQRAQLAADILDGRVTIDASTLTAKQVIALARTNAHYVGAIRFPDRVRRRQQRKFAAFFDAIGPDGRAEMCRLIGVERIWNALTAAL